MPETNTLEEFLKFKEYTPSEVARLLSNTYGQKVTPSVIRKWDNLILSEAIMQDRRKGANRKYVDIKPFFVIAVLRGLGYSIEDTRELVRIIFNYRAIANRGSELVKRCEEMLKELKAHMEEQVNLLAQVNLILDPVLKELRKR